MRMVARIPIKELGVTFLRLDAHKMQQQVVSESTQGAELATTHYKVEEVFQAHNVSRLRDPFGDRFEASNTHPSRSARNGIVG